MKGTLTDGPDEHLDAARVWRDLLRDWQTKDYPALVRLRRRLEPLVATPEIERRLLQVRIAILSTATVDFLLPVLDVALLAAGMRPTLHIAPYGQVSTSLLAATGPVVEFRPQVTLLMTATPHLPGWPAITASRQDVDALVDEVCDALLAPAAAFHSRTGSEIVINTFHPPAGRPAGNLGAKLPGDPTQFIRRVNLALSDRAPRYVHIHDVAALAERSGVDAWFDERYWHLAKQPMSFERVPDYCHSLAATVGAILGRTRKCLVLDLDNTLWGGVIGDDGIAGIRIGEGSDEGEAFKTFQMYIRALKDRGVLLAVCSKNDDRIARSAFTDHPEMVLRQADFVAFKANWQPKSENLRAIARELDLPLEAFVFVDDNPAERDEVARALPDVAVPQLPDDPGSFVRALDAERLFEIASLTTEDLGRTATYQARRQTLEALTTATDVGAYLQSLNMTASIRPFEPISFERITQLVNKTNQFNLTTQRVVLADIERLSSDPAAVTLTARLRDRFADHGLISVVFGRVTGPRLVLDAWLMSCRVLGRGMERALFNELLAIARARGLQEIIGIYKPTDRNGLVKDHYAGLGFARVSELPAAGGPPEEHWRLELAGATPLDTFITVDTEPNA
jgi:FkbH-like protein